MKLDKSELTKQRLINLRKNLGVLIFVCPTCEASYKKNSYNQKFCSLTCKLISKLREIQ